jgi:hypothetical protein
MKGNNMTIANQIKTTIETQCPGTFSLYAGYGLDRGQPVRYPTGVQLVDVRNPYGRCIKAQYQYADDSVLTYQWSESKGYTLTAKAGKGN